MEEKFFLNVFDRKICVVLHSPERRPDGCVITCHGLFSSKDSDKFIGIAQRFTAAGLAVIRFDFSGCGESSGHISETTVTRRMQELEAVAAFCADRQKQFRRRPCLLGSSLGGFLCLLHAARRPGSVLSLWATPYDLPEIAVTIPPEELKVLKQDFFVDARSFQLDPILGAVSRAQLIHGRKDTIVPWHHAEKIFSLINQPKELVFLPNSDHSLTDPKDRVAAIKKSLAWFLQNL